MKAITILSGLLTPIIAIIAVYIAYQQHLLSKKKLMLELYDKRYSIFIKLKDLLLQMNMHAKIDTKELGSILATINDNRFLFENDITEFIAKIRINAIELTTANRHLEHPDNYNREQIGEDQEKARKLERWFSKEYLGVEDRFLAYLNFKQLK